MSGINDSVWIDSSEDFIVWLRDHESWLMERILHYAKENDYTKYTSTLVEPWRISIVGLTDSLHLLMQRYPTPPPLHPDENFSDDPASAFGLLEAHRHRSRGVNFAMFISLFKYYRQTYHDLIEENKECFRDPSFYYEYVKQFFDRVEIAYSIEWHGRSAEDQIHELSAQNRHLTNEKNLYLTVFDSFSSAAILLDSYGVILNYNQNASEVLFDTKHHSGRYYYEKNKTVSTPEWISDAITDLGDFENKRFFYEQIRSGTRYIYDVFIRPMDDISGKFSGYIVILNDVSELKASDEQYELAINASSDGLWDWNLIDDTIYFSPQWKKMVGYEDDELINDLETWKMLVHPDDLSQAIAAVEESLKNPNTPYANTHRLRHKDGHYIWNYDHGKVLYSEAGKPIRMIGFHTDISRTKELEEKLELLKAAIENAPMSFVITDAEGKIEYVNPWFIKLTGYTIDEALGENPRILKSGFTSQDEYEELWDDITHKMVWHGTFKNIKKNGDEYWESATIIPIKSVQDEITHYLGIKQEITESQHLREMLMKNETMIHYLGAIVEEATTEIYIFDAETLQFLYANKSALSNIGYTREELYTLTPIDLKPLDKNEFYSYVERVANEGYCTFRTSHIRKDETSYPVSVIIQPTFYDDRQSYVAMISDMSDQEHMIHELQHTQEMMISQSSHAAMGEMISMIAHQWRQPLSIVSMIVNNVLVDIDLDGVNEEQCKKSGANILEQMNYLSKTIDVFRDFFRPSNEKEKTDLIEILHEAESMIDASLKNNAIVLEIINPLNVRPQISSRELLQVIINILKNAKEALVTNEVKDPIIRIDISIEGENVCVDICNNGPSIPIDVLPRIFEPYFSTKDEKTGAGLGLYISKIVVEKHLAGMISASNTEKGVCFIIKIPYMKFQEQ